MSRCEKCSAPLPSHPGKFCPRCGEPVVIAAPSKVVHLEKRGTLWNVPFICSVILTVAGGLLAGQGLSWAGLILLVIGVLSLLYTAVRSLSRH